jgi:antitoxin (DNA-binding transcriptional repressor) of toxin-antitoxin stability system
LTPDVQNVHYIDMQTITTTNARKNISRLIDQVKYSGEAIALGRRDFIDALIIPFPHTYNKQLDEITNLNAYSKSFDFLADEPNIYSVSDLKKKYV